MRIRRFQLFVLVAAVTSCGVDCSTGSNVSTPSESDSRSAPGAEEKSPTGSDDRAGGSETENATDENRRIRLRDRSRLVLEEACGECHIGDYDTSIPAALEVFDLRDPEWAADMTASQLEQLPRRIDDEQFPSRTNPDGRPNDLSDEERQVVKDYVDVELSRRGADDEQ